MKKLLVALALLLLPASASAQAKPAKFPGIEMAANNSMPVCTSGSACIRYNSATAIYEISISTAAYAAMITANSTATLTNKTITAAVLSGSFTGTYTLAGTPTITSPTISGPLITGTTTMTQAKPSRLANNSSAPTVAVGSAAQLGTSPAAAMAGGDVGARVTLTTGTGPTAFSANTAVTLGIVTFNTTFSSIPQIGVLSPCNSAAANIATGATGISVFIDRATFSTTQVTVKMISSAIATLAASTAYEYCFVVIQ